MSVAVDFLWLSNEGDDVEGELSNGESRLLLAELLSISVGLLVELLLILVGLLVELLLLTLAGLLLISN